MNRHQAIKTIKNGKFFSVEFIKKDGTLRKLHGRCGVVRYANGKGRKYNPSELGYITVFDLQANNYRLVDSRSILKVNNIEVK